MRNTNILTWTRVIILPVLYFLSVLFLLLMFLSPHILAGQLELVKIAPGLYVMPANNSWNGDGPTIYLGLLGSCSKANNSGSLKCQGTSVMPKYDYSVLRAGQSTTPEISAVATSAVWMTLCLLFWGIPFFYFPPVWIRWHKVDIESRGHRVMGIVAIVACFGYLLGALVFFITYFNLSLRVDEFDQAIARLGPAGPTVQASLGPGCTFGGTAFALGITPFGFMIIDAANLSGWTNKRRAEEQAAQEQKNEQDEQIRQWKEAEDARYALGRNMV